MTHVSSKTARNGQKHKERQRKDEVIIMENQDERYIVEYDTQTGEPIYSDGSRGPRPGAQKTVQAEEIPSGTYRYTGAASNWQPEPEPQPQAQPEPEPQPQSNIYQFQDTEAIRPKKKKVKKGWTMPKVAIGAALFGVIAAGCFFGVNAGLNALTGGAGEQTETEQLEQTKVEAHTDDSKITSAGVSDVSGIVENVMPSVVGILETQTVQNMFGQQYEAQGAGSGFIVKQDNDELLVVTNAHVVADAKKINIVFCDNETAEATVKGVSSSNDIALLTVDMSKMKDSTKKEIRAATLRSSDDVKVGEMAIAIGNANGNGQSVTVGYVSAKDRTFVVGTTNSNGKTNTRPMLQTDAAINPGNSGGPLIDANGRVIGITTSKEFTATDGRDVVGMNYAIPMSDGVSIINDLMNREVLKDTEKGYLGITGETIDSAAAKQYNMPEGVYVKSISDTGAAAKAGIHQGDIITALDGTKVSQISEIKEIVNSRRIGTTIEVTLQRNTGKSYEEQKVKVTLASKDTLDGLPDETEESKDDQEKKNPYERDNQDDGGGYQIIPWGFGN